MAVENAGYGLRKVAPQEISSGHVREARQSNAAYSGPGQHRGNVKVRDREGLADQITGRRQSLIEHRQRFLQLMLRFIRQGPSKRSMPNWEGMRRCIVGILEGATLP